MFSKGIARALVIVMVATGALFAGTQPSMSDPGNDHSADGRQVERSGLQMSQAVLTAEGLLNEESKPPEAAAASCSIAPASQRLTTAPNPGSTPQLVMVYVTPTHADTSWTDSYLDLPRECDNGVAWSPMDYMYRNIAHFYESQLNRDTSIGARRPATSAHTYTWSDANGTHSKSLYAAYYVESSNTYAYLCNLYPGNNIDNDSNDKLLHVRAILANHGFNNPNAIYMAILHTNQCTDDPRTTDDERDILGVAWRDGRVSAAPANGQQFGYVMRSNRNATIKFGCASAGDTGFTHEFTHVLGAVPPGAPAYDGKGHMNSIHPDDLMAPVQNNVFSTGAMLDQEASGLNVPSNYRAYITRTDVNGRNYTPMDSLYLNSAYRTC